MKTQEEQQEAIINKLKEINTKMENLSIQLKESLDKLLTIANTEEYDRKG